MFCPYLKGTGGEAQGGHAEYMLMKRRRRYVPDSRQGFLRASRTDLLRRCEGLSTRRRGNNPVPRRPHNGIADSIFVWLWIVMVQSVVQAQFTRWEL
jgi:hypothetical protein